MALLVWCGSSFLSLASGMPSLAIEPLSIQSHRVLCCVPSSSWSRDTQISLGRLKFKGLGSLRIPYLKRMATQLQRTGLIAEDVLSKLGSCRTGLPDGSHHKNKGSEGLNEEILGQLGPETDCATYALLLRRCASAKALSQGKLVHEHMSRRGYAGNRFLSNLLVQMYSKCGNLKNARAVFDSIIDRDSYSWNIMIAACTQNGSLDGARALFAEMPQRDVVSWNAMISACAQLGLAKEALQLFGQMQAEGFKANKISFICILDAFANVEVLEESRAVHAAVARNGWESDVVLATALINMYGRCRSLGDARAVFEEMPQRDVVCWNALIGSCAQNGNDKDALILFGQMQAEGFEPNKITFICVLYACSSVAALKDGRAIHATVAGDGCESDVIVRNAFIDMYSKCGSLDDAKAVFADIPERDVVTWSAMIGGCVQNGDGKEALQLFGQMQAEGFELCKITVISIIDACASVVALEEGRSIHATVAGSGWELDTVVGTALVNMYGKCGRLDDARAVFVETPQQDVVSWSAMIGACTQNEHGNEALQLFVQMQVEEFEIDKITFICIVDACASVAALEEGRLIHAIVAGNRWESDKVMGNALINMYGKCGSLDDAMGVFVDMPRWDLVSWNAMIAACARNRHGKRALQLFGQMQAQDFEADKMTCICIVDACASVAALEEGQMIHATVAGNGWETDVVLRNALVNMYGKCGSLDTARALFMEMPHRDVVSWNAMISACAQNGQGKEALQLFDQMQGEDFKPDMVTYISVLTACSHTGLLADASRYFASMKRDHGITPSVEHYVCMIDLLGRRGLLEEAEDLVISMPFENVSSAWLSLLSSCRIHNDVERALHTINSCLS